MNKKNDSKAKLAFVGELERRGYENVKIVAAPSDIVAEKGGEMYYFEIKMTHQKERYFGAATLTEWEQAVKTPDHYRFVVVKANEDDSEFEFLEFTPEEFMQYSTVPPFKLFFNIDFNDLKKVISENGKSIKVTKKNIAKMLRLFEEMKQ